jgi:anti-sigma B factor antagonist
MDTSVDQQGNVRTVHVSGSVDGLTAEDLQRVLTGEVEAGHQFLIADFGAVDYTSSAGLRVLLATVKQTRSRGGDLRLAAPRPEVRKVLELSGFTTILRVFESVEGAVRSYGRESQSG